MAMMAMTTRSSISVNPLRFGCMFHLVVSPGFVGLGHVDRKIVRATSRHLKLQSGRFEIGVAHIEGCRFAWFVHRVGVVFRREQDAVFPGRRPISGLVGAELEGAISLDLPTGRYGVLYPYFRKRPSLP